MTLAAQLPVLAAAVFLIGTPHGALDVRVGRSVLQPTLERAWLPAFLLLYLAVAGAILLWWLAAPGAALAAFLLLAAVHFGSQDSLSGAPAAVFARGAIPPVIAAAAHRDELGTIFGWLAGNGGAALVPWLAGPGLLVWLCAAILTLALEPQARRRLELVGTAALFVVLPPLLAFAAYFALVHTPRALRSSLLPGESVAGMLRAALPCSLAALALAGAGYLVLRGQVPGEVAVVRTVFWWLAALTVPHMGLHLLAGHPSRAAEIIPPRSSAPTG
jgi:beta-carotene 15,15'-dioxygenase